MSKELELNYRRPNKAIVERDTIVKLLRARAPIFPRIDLETVSLQDEPHVAYHCLVRFQHKDRWNLRHHVKFLPVKHLDAYGRNAFGDFVNSCYKSHYLAIFVEGFDEIDNNQMSERDRILEIARMED